MASQRVYLADSQLAPFWVWRRVVQGSTTLNRSMLQLATGHAAGRSGTAIEKFGSDRAFKFVIDHTSGSELSPRLAGCSLCAKLASLMVVGELGRLGQHSHLLATR